MSAGTTKVKIILNETNHMYMYMYDKGRERGEGGREEGGGGREGGREGREGREGGGREGGRRSNLRLVRPTPFILYCFLCLVDRL